MLTVEATARLIADLAVPLLVPLLAWLGSIAAKWHINSTVLRAVARGAGVAYLALLEERRGTGGLPQAIAQGASYVEARVPDYLGKLGITSDRLDGMVRGELGKLLAADPSIKIGPGA